MLWSSSIQKAIVLEFLPQCCSIDAEKLSGLALIALGVIHDRLEQWLLDFAEHEIIKATGLMAIQVSEISLQGFFGQIP
jgi:hypothetical protein